MGIKMIVTDLDGTFLRDDKTVSDYTRDVFRRCREKGIKLVFATGRSSYRQIPRELFDGEVLSNGAVAFVGDERIYHKPMPIAQARKLLTTAENAGMYIVASRGDRHLANFNLREATGYLDGEIADFNKLDFEPHIIFSSAKTAQEIEFFENNLPENYHMIVFKDGMALIAREEAVKSKAVAAVAGYWGIKPAEIAGFGDDLNDIDLLQYCGVGVAMANAQDETKQVANQICDTNENDGVARWIEENLLRNEL
ncbi:MAG: Cof-type HAD-IIB family hydrolase [Defluviitaleaceae bacterium]|nr:Cof-type HAD-IIB family hydrolase [Defluviitaleaceae bacterium]